MNTLVLRNRQRTRPVDGRRLRQLIRVLLEDLLELPAFELGISLVAGPEMTRLNETFLHHAGATDVIAFDYAEAARPGRLHGELFLCVDEAVAYARRYRTTWEAELVRYLVHGLLHLQGYDDRTAPQRRRMKRVEDRLVRTLARRFPLNELARPSIPTRQDAGLKGRDMTAQGKAQRRPG